MSENTSRREGGLGGIGSAQPDVVSGVWTCCHNIDPLAEGCVLGPHCDAELQCARCGGWVPLAKWSAERCVAHPGRAERSRWGGALWSCCGAAGLEGTRWAYRGGAEWIERRVAGLSDAEWQRRRRGARPPTGCRDGRHEWQLPPGRLEPRCDACGSPWDESGTRGKAGCGVCGAARRLCTQCWAVLPEATFLRGGCRFHPGSFCESRTIRFATKQRSGGALVRIGTADADVKCSE